mmetsp:Transcript_52127/g.140319  ORF Transcript_52127/g.140319 Transcript_52127/m.140319 type:complete len:221 (-) Transcript_52127:74-736(-)
MLRGVVGAGEVARAVGLRGGGSTNCTGAGDISLRAACCWADEDSGRAGIGARALGETAEATATVARAVAAARAGDAARFRGEGTCIVCRKRPAANAGDSNTAGSAGEPAAAARSAGENPRPVRWRPAPDRGDRAPATIMAAVTAAATASPSQARSAGTLPGPPPRVPRPAKVAIASGLLPSAGRLPGPPPIGESGGARRSGDTGESGGARRRGEIWPRTA